MSNMITRSINCFILFTLCGVIKACQGSFMIYREMWHATPVEDYDQGRQKPSNWIIVHESGGATCSNSEECRHCVKTLQFIDLKTRKDIRYNFLIGGDGMVYEGRGWYKNSISIPEYDSESITVAFIGTFEGTFLTTMAWDTFRNFLKFAEMYRFLNKNYKLIAHRQFEIIPKICPIYYTTCPGSHVFELLDTFPQWFNGTITIYR